MSRISDLVENHTSGHTSDYISEALPADVKSAVDHPTHYQSKTGLEAIDVIEAFDLNFNLGNVIKYILRCGKKDAAVQELAKAKWYLEREIANRKTGNDCLVV